MSIRTQDVVVVIDRPGAAKWPHIGTSGWVGRLLAKLAATCAGMTRLSDGHTEDDD